MFNKRKAELYSASDAAIKSERAGELSDSDFMEWQDEDVPKEVEDRFREKHLEKEKIIPGDIADNIISNFTKNDKNAYDKIMGTGFTSSPDAEVDLGEKNAFLFDRMSKVQKRDLVLENADREDSEIMITIETTGERLRNVRQARLAKKAENEILDTRIIAKKLETARDKEKDSMSFTEEIEMHKQVMKQGL